MFSCRRNSGLGRRLVPSLLQLYVGYKRSPLSSIYIFSVPERREKWLRTQCRSNRHTGSIWTCEGLKLKLLQSVKCEANKKSLCIQKG